MITNPSLLILDEPTSGLDSFSSLRLLRLLRRIARQGKTVVASVHSPNSEGFLLFDKLLVLADGHLVFQGEAKLAHEYFASVGFECPPFSNPADFFMRAFAVAYPLSEADAAKIAFLKRKYDARIAPSVKQECDEIKLLHPNLDYQQN